MHDDRSAPNPTPPRPCLVLLVGRPGTGKTRLGRLLAERLGATMVQSDVVRHELFAEPAYSAAEGETVYAECRRLLGAALARGETAIYDATNLKERQREPACTLAEQAGAELAIVALAASAESARRHLEQRQRSRDPWDQSDATWEVYLTLGPFEPISRPHLLLNADVDLSVLLGLVETRLRQICAGGSGRSS